MVDVDQIDVVTVVDTLELFGTGLAVLIRLAIIFLLDDGVTRILELTPMWVWFMPCDMWVGIATMVLIPFKIDVMVWVGVGMWEVGGWVRFIAVTLTWMWLNKIVICSKMISPILIFILVLNPGNI